MSQANACACVKAFIWRTEVMGKALRSPNVTEGKSSISQTT